MTSVRDLILGLPYVVAKRLNGRDGFFTAGRMFALLSAETLLIRLPQSESGPVVNAEPGRVMGPPIPAALVWVELSLATVDRTELRYRIAAAHETVRAASRRARRERSAQRLRRSRSSA